MVIWGVTVIIETISISILNLLWGEHECGGENIYNSETNLYIPTINNEGIDRMLFPKGKNKLNFGTLKIKTKHVSICKLAGVKKTKLKRVIQYKTMIGWNYATILFHYQRVSTI